MVNSADEIAYDSHDLDDGLTSNLLTEAQLKKVILWKETAVRIKKKYGSMKKQVQHFQIIKEIINTQATDLIKNTEKKIKRNNIIIQKLIQAV